METTIKILKAVLKVKNKALDFFNWNPTPVSFETRRKYEAQISEIEKAIEILKKV